MYQFTSQICLIPIYNELINTDVMKQYKSTFSDIKYVHQKMSPISIRIYLDVCMFFWWGQFPPYRDKKNTPNIVS